MWPEIPVVINDADWELLGELDSPASGPGQHPLHLHAAGWLRAPLYAWAPLEWAEQNNQIFPWALLPDLPVPLGDFLSYSVPWAPSRQGKEARC